MTGGALPNLIVIGAMKCGTTSLNDYLALHPQIHMAAAKEINWFSGEQAHRPIEWYKAQFDPAFPVRGEASQNYSKAHHPFYRDAPARMAELIPDAKLLYIVRDPIERYRSHIVENNLDEPDEDRAWNLANDHHFETGRYAWQLKPFLEHYPMEQIMVVDSDDLRRDRLATMNGIFAFLGVDAVTDPGLFVFESNTIDSNMAPLHWRLSLPYRIAHRLAPFDFHRFMAHPFIRRHFYPALLKPDLSDEEIARLRERYAPDVAELRALTGQAFAGWQV
ncbi:MAG TPA: sulfotransferase [Sphingopyxis sp.]|nr:sulfotransferase [Sphingopyxis sp.]HMP44167.1 sulfotransferase [Sphingopyxis sp.]HMQ18341.1 sulfotransferase [Sphingopyxis sp.]